MYNPYDQFDQQSPTRPAPTSQPRIQYIDGPPEDPSELEKKRLEREAAIRAGRNSDLDARIKSLEIAKKRQELSVGAEGVTPRGDTRLTGEDYLKTLPTSDAAMIRAMSQGRAVYTMQFSRYEEAPKAIQEQIVESAKGKAVAA